MKGVLHLVVQMHAPLQGGGVCVLLEPRVRALRPQQRHVRPEVWRGAQEAAEQVDRDGEQQRVLRRAVCILLVDAPG